MKCSNERLFLEKKKREEFILNKPILIRQIKEYQKKVDDLEDEEKKNQENINLIQNRGMKIQPKKELIKTFIEKNPDDCIDQKIKLFNSLIKESKERQNEFIDLFEYYNDYIQQKNNYEKIKNEANLIEKEKEKKNNNKSNSKSISSSKKDKNHSNDKSVNNDENDYSGFICSSSNSTNRKNDINIDKTKDEKEQKEFNNFKFLLSIMFYIKNISRDKIENIILNYRTQNYYLDNLDNKNNYLLKLSKDILHLINDKNENDINLFKKLFLFLFDEKYKNNKELFLNNIINDFDESNQLLFKKDEENQLFERITKEYLNNSNSIIEKINKSNNQNVISYKDLKKILKEEKLYIKKDKEKIQLFKFFIYLLKKNSSLNNKKNSIADFSVKDIIDFFKKNENTNKEEKNMEKEEEEDSNNEEISLTNEEVKKILDNFYKNFKKFLNDIKLKFKEFIGENNIEYIKKNDNEIPIININTFFELLKKNDFQVDNLTLSVIFSSYKVDENSYDININLIDEEINK